MKLHILRSTRLLAIATTMLGSLLITACGGGGGSGGGGSSSTPPSSGASPVSLSGVVADGLISGARVCYDLNDNGRCDSGEPVSTNTGADGRYTMSVPASEAGKHAIIAIVPVGAVDMDTGTVTVAYTLSAPPNTNTSSDIFVSPITTIVQEVMKASGTTDPAAAIELVKQQLGMQISPLDNFIALRATNSDAARVGSIAQVITALQQEVGSTAATAGVNETQTTALISFVVLNNLTNLAQSVAENTSPTLAAQSLATSQGITSATVATQAQIASSISSATTDTVTTTASPTAFVSLRDFRYTNSSNWSYRVFTGDDVTRSDGYKRINDVRVQASGKYNRNASYYDATAGKWYECPSDGFEAIVYKDVTATAPGESLFCRTYSSTSRRTVENIAGLTFASVVDRVRKSGLPGYDTWAGATTTLANPSATFPAGSELRYQVTTDISTPIGHNLSDKVRVFKNTATASFNDWPFATTLEEMIQFYPGNFNGGSVNGASTDGLGQIPDASYTAPNMQQLKNFRVAFQSTSATGGNARFWLCRRNATPNTNTNCTVDTTQLFDTTYTIETLGDARVLKFTRLPEEIQGFRKFARVYVERAGAVFYGFKDNLQVVTTVRLNTPAWNALRAQYPGVTTHTNPTAPVAVDAASWLRDMRSDLLGADNFSIRWIDSQVTNTSTGSGSFSEVRLNYVNGVKQAYNRNSLYLVGGVWKTSMGLTFNARATA